MVSLIYVSGRTQRVKVGDKVSNVCNINSKVKKGSHIGPVNFLSI